MITKGYYYTEYHSQDRTCFIRIKSPRKWEIWWKSDFMKVAPTRKLARDCIRAMKKGDEEMHLEDRAMYEAAMKAMKKLIGSYILVGRLCERVENTVASPRYLIQENTELLKKAQEEAAELLGAVTKFFRHAGDFLV
jgi:hypothetical protein